MVPAEECGAVTHSQSLSSRARTVFGETRSTRLGVVNRVLRVERESLTSSLVPVISSCLTAGSFTFLNLVFFLICKVKTLVTTS